MATSTLHYTTSGLHDCQAIHAESHTSAYQKYGNKNGRRYPVPAESGKRVGLDIAQEPFDRNKRNSGSNHETEPYHAPILRRRACGMVQRLENLNPPAASMVGMP